MNKCELHNWLYEEFDETCPLCDAVNAYKEDLVQTDTFMGGFYRGRAEGVEQERERILKLLEEYEVVGLKHNSNNSDFISTDLLIALIKGEN